MTDNNKLGVYVHWPYCARICPYCDFNVYKTRAIDSDRWSAAFSAELTHAAQLTPPRPLTSLYFGGGTPSLCPPEILSTIIDQCQTLFGFIPGAEITLEANPADLSADTMRILHQIGVNRLSLGVQSFDDGILRALGRDHDGETAHSAITDAQSIFGNVTFDLIYGVPGQSIDAWQTQLDQAIAFGTDHLSLYQLTIEPGTAFAKAQERGTLTMADDDDLATRYEMAIETLTHSGFDHYEISNFARSGRQAKHNLLYWRYQDYLGVGPGAHGRLSRTGESQTGDAGRLATQTVLTPESWLTACDTNGHGFAETETLSAQAQMQERFSMGLRLKEGINLPPDDVFFDCPERVKKLDQLIQDGLIDHENQRLQASAHGRQLLDWVLAQLLT